MKPHKYPPFKMPTPSYAFKFPTKEESEQDGEEVEQYCSNCGAVLPWHESQCAKDPDYGDDEDE